VTDKLYTVEEANALLPFLAPTLIELRAKSAEAERIQETMERAAVTNGGSQRAEKWNKTLARVSELVERLNEWEVQVRDLETGLVDFPAHVDGRMAYLCWKLGEPEVRYWHSPEDGFRGRRLL
jgi:hypothetical protein